MGGTMLRCLSVIVCPLLISFSALAANLDKQQKKHSEAKAKTLVEQAKALEKQKHLLEARDKYAEPQALLKPLLLESEPNASIEKSRKKCDPTSMRPALHTMAAVISKH
jgi:hypothetical protein